MKNRSKISIKIFNIILIIEFFIWGSILFIVLLPDNTNSQRLSPSTIVGIIALLFFSIITPFLIKKILKLAFEDLENSKYSRQYVFKNLSRTYDIQVIPIKDEPEHEKFLTVELQKRATFYARIMDDNTVMISIKFNGEQNKIFYGGLQLENFTTFFKIIEF